MNASLEKALVDAGGNEIITDDKYDSQDSKILTGFPKLIRNVYLKHFKPIYLIFDQFEELYILGNPSEQALFIQAIK